MHHAMNIDLLPPNSTYHLHLLNTYSIHRKLVHIGMGLVDTLVAVGIAGRIVVGKEVTISSAVLGRPNGLVESVLSMGPDMLPRVVAKSITFDSSIVVIKVMHIKTATG